MGLKTLKKSHTHMEHRPFIDDSPVLFLIDIDLEYLGLPAVR
jgi:hypothetical protein